MVCDTFTIVGARNPHRLTFIRVTFLDMPRRKAAANGGVDGNEPSTTASPKIVVADSEPRDVIKANNANLTELKHTLDDALKRVRRLINSECSYLTCDLWDLLVFRPSRSV